MSSAMALEVGLAVLILLVFVVGLSWRGQDKRRLGVLVAIGLAILLWMAFRVDPGAVLFGGSFVQDELAIFSKRLFLLATFLGVLASISLRAPTFARRATEYYVAMLASLLGMLVLASARELILLFVAFELMSIPLYVISGFSSGKRRPSRPRSSSSSSAPSPPRLSRTACPSSTASREPPTWPAWRRRSRTAIRC